MTALGLALTGVRPAAWLVCAAVAVVLFQTPIINGLTMAVFQSKTAPALQGRVFAIGTTVAYSMIPLAYITAGYLADRVFEPAFRARGALVTAVGQVIGTGQGRGIAFLFILTALLPLLGAAFGFLHPRVRRIEEEMPDVVA